MCLDCCLNQVKEIFLCPVYDCPLYLFRMGRSPKTSELTKEFVEKKTELFSEELKKEILNGGYPLLPTDEKGYPKDVWLSKNRSGGDGH
jgi:hypothetical protein